MNNFYDAPEWQVNRCSELLKTYQDCQGETEIYPDDFATECMADLSSDADVRCIASMTLMAIYSVSEEAPLPDDSIGVDYIHTLVRSVRNDACQRMLDWISENTNIGDDDMRRLVKFTDDI